ncbi:MAG: TIR domain-containing protein [Anaerolineae bacterium]|nr:TIR domain-containing protein [Anaerolineae bacterium]
MPRIFISYRHADSRQVAGRIYDRLVRAFGKKNVFKDIENIPPGADFRDVIVREVSQCDVVLVIIGKNWLNVTDEHGQRRLDNPRDFVRIEIETALARVGTTVIPVRVEGAGMPGTADLPDSLRDLSFISAAVVQDDPNFHHDVDRLIKAINKKYAKPAARIVGLFLVLLLFIMMVGLILSDVFEEETAEKPTEAVHLLTATDTPVPSTTFTNTPTKTSTATFTPSNTPAPTRSVYQLAWAGVSSNDEWTPYSEEINGVEMVLVPAGCFMMWRC